jgi:16S rRNA (cytosine1402-N4)-methyltransferase
MTLHVPVLKDEVIKLLNIKSGDIVVDATLGGGGHSEPILEKIGESGKLVAIDLDIDAVERFKFKVQSSKFKVDENLFLVNDSFANLENILKKLKIGKVNAVLADLGWSSDQLSGRGMSFAKDEPLDMRLDREQELTAEKVVNEYDQNVLEKILKEYGEEKFAKNIARKIIEQRKNKSIETTGELSELIRGAIPARYQHGKINPATRTFQAIRIEVNKELGNLEKFIPEAIAVLKQKGRLAVISFHSLEDRIVKNIFRQNAGGCICPSNFPECRCGKSPAVKIITKKPTIPGEEESKNNPRSRSAKLRICEKI